MSFMKQGCVRGNSSTFRHRWISSLAKLSVGGLLFLVGIVAPLGQAYADECPLGGEHTYSATIIEYASADTDGLRNYICTKCGYSIDKVIPATGHAWEAWTTAVEPTCTDEGQQSRACTKHSGAPHYEYQVIPALSPSLDHEYALIEDDTPTCTEPGVHGYKCAYCSESYSDVEAALGHSWGPWEVVVEATTTQEGQRQRVCSRDVSHVEYEVLPRIEKAPSRPSGPEPSKPEIRSDEIGSLAVAEAPSIPQPGFFTFSFGAFDAVFIALDALLIMLFFVVAIPLIARYRWTRNKFTLAREKSLRKETDSTPERVWY